MAFVRSLSKTVSVFVFGVVLLDCFAVDKFGSHAQVVTPLLPQDEVEILQSISNSMNYYKWTIDRASCGSAQWNQTIVDDKILSIVTCDCTFDNNTVCHVISYKLKGFNLTGVLPVEFRNLTQLREIDLSRNCIGGPIPASFAELPNLQNLSLLANSLEGSIPQDFGSIATLETLVLENNLLEGPLHPDLGNLRSLKRLLLSGNNFTGRIPDTFGNLKNLTDFRIDGSELSGKIPDFIGNWTNIGRLDLQGTSMEGPIPPTISFLKNLTELRISDLKGSSSTFPYLQDMPKMARLILRNCSMTGSIPKYVGNMAGLRHLDLSFNKLTGQIPGQLQSLTGLNFMFLNDNLLTGEVPGWILDSTQQLDLSYNNFTGSPQLSCQQLPVNLVASHVSIGNNEIPWCLNKDLICTRQPQHHSLFINCGGRNISNSDNEYEDDITPGGPAEFASFSERWGYSSTGTYMNNDKVYPYIATNSFGLNVSGEEFYETARLAPQSLKYYGLCMRPGSYKVQLHFAEIMYSNDQTFSSLGRRIFDISIQGKVVETNFNIMEEAGGVGIGITKLFDNIIVNGSTLEIHLYWSGKGTTAVPDRGVYGPLISAITVTPNFKVDNGGGLSVGAIIGIVVAPCVLAALVLLFLRKKGYLGGKDLEDKGNNLKMRRKIIISIGTAFRSAGALLICIILYFGRKASSIIPPIFLKKKQNQELEAFIRNHGPLALKRYNFADVKKMTNFFKDKLGQGGYGIVYQGKLMNGHLVAVKVMKASKGTGEEFINEVASISRTSHVNIVSLLGFCFEGDKRVLIFDFMPNGSLEKFINHENSLQASQQLGWEKLYQIVVGVARGLEYLHRGCNTRIVHFDIKPHNILLDADFCPKISDFGLAKPCARKESIVSLLEARGTIGYIAPEVFSRNFGQVSYKSDVYSYGMMVLEMVGGRKNHEDEISSRSEEYFPQWIYKRLELDNEFELNGAATAEETEIVRKITIVGLWCIQTNPSDRPSMSKVIEMLEGPIGALKIPPKPFLCSPPRLLSYSSTTSLT